ncbi:hypothetical protein MCAP1_002549 [Malassezia caprae]|uniref:Cytoplasmic dynein 1 intermediate chain 2 n=1 Tax=Malassezia caprae TaxID=1381934 RepID=A0AAF0J0S9_9BASI|nr:hypothetical protein MCAP1_002549 [Malassezia caprae]
MSARRAEIEAKRAKLAELRRAREERARKMQASVAPGAPAPAGAPGATQSVDELLASLLPPAPEAPRAPEAAPVPEAPADAPAAPAPPSPEATPDTLVAPAASAPEAAAPAPPEAPPERILYSKEVQTDPAPELAPEAPMCEDEAPSAAPPAVEDVPRAPIVQAAAPVSDDFTAFVQTKSMVMERILDEPYDVLTDYTHVPVERDESQASIELVRTFHNDTWLATRSVTDLDWSAKHPELVIAAYNRKRVLAEDGDHDGLVAVWNMHVRERPEFVFSAPTDVVSVLASPFHPHLLVGGTYSGQVLLWDTRHRDVPVQRTPLAFAAHGATTHAAPVYSLRMIGSAHAHQLVSASMDGVVCTWSLDMLARPQESLVLTNPLHPRSAQVGVTSLDVAPRDPSRFLVATEEGNLFGTQRFDRAGVQAGLDTSRVYVGHSAPVTRLECHPAQARGESAPHGLSGLFLTTSMDWTSALWRMDAAPSSSSSGAYHYPHANPRIATSQRTNPLAFRAGTPTWTAIAPLVRFENQHNYVMDARWHPQHPAVFAQVDASGQLDVYHMGHSLDRPLLTLQTPSARALNRVAWDKRGALPEHGAAVAQRLATGGVDGRVHVYKVAEAHVTPRGEADWAAMAHALQQAPPERCAAAAAAAAVGRASRALARLARIHHVPGAREARRALDAHPHVVQAGRRP